MDEWGDGECWVRVCGDEVYSPRVVRAEEVNTILSYLIKHDT